MTVRQVKADEIAAFLSFPGTSENQKQAVQRMIDDGRTRPEWCFMAADGERTVARIGFWAPPSSPANSRSFALWLPWDGDFLPLGRDLFEQSLAVMRRQGARTIECKVLSRNSTHQQQRLLYESCGLVLIQEKGSFIRDSFQPLPDDSDRLLLKSRTETGDDLFINAIERVTELTLDRADRKDLIEKGSVAAAAAYFDSLRDIDDNPNLWMLGYDNTGTLVGLVVPQLFDDQEGAINYIGVVPEQRGKGYGGDLLRAGTKLLCQKGIRRILADIDTENAPMIDAVAGLDFKREYIFWIYQANLLQQK